MTRVRRLVRRRARAGAAAALGAACAGACVRVDSGPGGVASARLEVPPSIVAGDVLRDSAGLATTLKAVAFDEGGRPVASPSLRFVYVPTRRDTLQRLVLDSALVVDSLTGAVAARAAFVVGQGLVAVRVGDRLQVIDTLEIVPRPDSARVDTAVTLPLRFTCADTSRTRSLRPLAAAGGFENAFVFNAIGPFRVLVRGDSVTAGAPARVPVRQRLVRWSVGLASGAAIPVVRSPGGTAADTVPAVGIVSPEADRLTRLDTTDAAGRSTVQLRIRPFALGPRVVATDTFTVQLRALVQPGPVAIRGGDALTFRVRLERQPGASCP